MKINSLLDKNIQTRRYTAIDHPKVLDLIRAVYGERTFQKAVQRFEWQYAQNPNSSPEDPLIFVIEEHEKIIGMVGAFAQKVKINDALYPAYWVGDFMVHPEHRCSNHGLRLARMISAQPHLMMGFPEVKTVKIWARAKWVPFSQLVEYLGITLPVFIYNLKIKNKTINRCLHALYRFYERLKNIQPRQLPEGITTIEIKGFDERFDRFWEKASKDHKCLQARDSSFLNWRFFKCPYLNYRVLAAVKNNDILGFTVLRDEYINGIHEGSIVELFTGRTDNQAIAVLLHAGVTALKNIDCDVIKMIASSDDKMLNDALAKDPFFTSRKKEQGVFLNNTSNGLNSFIKESSNWFLTRTDSDMDFS